MQHRLLFALLLTSLVVTGPGFARAERLEHGTFEWSFAGSGSRESFQLDGSENGDRTRFSMITEVGYFLTPVFEIAINTGGTHTSIEPQGRARKKSNSFIFGGRLIVNVPNESRVTPYAYLGSGVRTYSGDEALVGSETASILPTMGVGARYFLGDHVSFNMQFDFSKIQNDNGVLNADTDVITFSFGFSTFLRRP